MLFSIKYGDLRRRHLNIKYNNPNSKKMLLFQAQYLVPKPGY